MKTAISLRIEADLLSAAREAAARDSRGLTDFIEQALREKIGADNGFQLVAPANARALKVLPEPGETAAETAEAQRVYDALLDLTGR